jgi:hypothetical protein
MIISRAASFQVKFAEIGQSLSASATATRSHAPADIYFKPCSIAPFADESTFIVDYANS